MSIKDLKGVIVPIMTPFNKDESINEDSLRKLVNFLIKNGVHGLMPTAATGEFPNLSIDERKKVWEIVFDEVDNKLPVVPCVAANTTSVVVELAQFAEKHHADGVMLTSPYYYKPTERELYGHVKTLAESVKLPIMIYNSKPAKVDLKPEFVASLAEIENVSYIKEGTNIERVYEIVKLTGHKMRVCYAGAGFIIEAIRLGAKGWITAMQNFIPAECVKLFEAAEQGDFNEAEKMFTRSVKPIWDIISSSEQGEQLAKAAADYIGLEVGEMRKPFSYPKEDEIMAIKKILDSLKPNYIDF